MTKLTRKHLETDVLVEARKRIHHIYDCFDTVVVCFSGGKDSLVALHLVKQVAEERGLTAPIKVMFKDQELIPDEVINFLDEYRQKDWVDMNWWAVPLHCTQFVLGKVSDIVQWDKTRDHLRPIPKWALTEGGGEIHGRDSFDKLSVEGYRGRVAYVTGIRASESLMRLRSCMNKVNENYINATCLKRLKLCKPIYDWQEDDVFKFFYDEGITYCPIYDIQHLVCRPLRVASPLQAEAAKDFDRLRASHPTYYEGLVKLFPDMLVQERYWRQTDSNQLLEVYGESFEGIRAFIEETLDDEKQYDIALKRLEQYKSLHRRSAAAYPIAHIFKYFIRGGFRKMLMPVATSNRKI